VKRHALSTRIWHWLNFACLVVLFMSGLNISNAHPRLYWGEWGFEAKDAWLFPPRFPGWATLPSHYSLAAARDWHILTAWVFALALLAYMTAALANRHFRRDIATSREEWRPEAIGRDVREHLRLNFDAEGRKYNFLQKTSYSLVIFVLLPLMIVTGMAISPGMDAAWPFLTEIFGGRQSARSIHFVCAWALIVFLVVHVVLVLLSNPLRQLREMITGGGKR
jgi:Ni/Fe-hydrogenase b-type cytochrome subunit